MASRELPKPGTPDQYYLWTMLEQNKAFVEAVQELQAKMVDALASINNELVKLNSTIVARAQAKPASAPAATEPQAQPAQPAGEDARKPKEEPKEAPKNNVGNVRPNNKRRKNSA